jgi:hypothetical protein
VTKPPELIRAEDIDHILHRYPGYTLSTLLREDAGELLGLLALVHED